MNHTQTFMTHRTIGLLATLSVLGVAGFTAALVLLAPNPTLSQMTATGKSDTRAIDASRSTANTSVTPQQRSATPQTPDNQLRSAVRSSRPASNNSTTAASPAPAATPTMFTQQPAAAPTPSAQPVVPAAQPLPSDRTPPAQNPVMALINNLIEPVDSL